ncbi:helix-turn-helix domain-containing protein [Rhizobium sp. KVB221]|uniref:Helix-turn-helix domain-containing protein n=1 Tax=Rhizobium setariae TaxID=2801340 RepID=A0A936YRV0_9HYPH|nr:helix-turn-helix domain-containing protein [Rhizobium setariae]MBL0374538.1 helix-turn-helix domain-containing protein [Rhizobium setariae]
MKTNVPTYGLYGEASEAVPDFWIHTESISERSSRFNWEIKQHRHENFFQILQIRSGTGDACIDSNIHRLNAGSIAFIPEKVTHGFRFSRDIDGQIITTLTSRLPIYAQRTVRLRAFIARSRLLDLDQQDADARYLIDTLDRIQGELATGFGARDGLIEVYLQIALTLAAGFEIADMGEDASASRDLARIGRLNTLIGKHFREHLPVEFYARELSVSVTHLNRITKAQTGRTMNELLSDKIVSQAKRDLVFTSMTAQEIAYTLGFADPAYFTRYFSREAGETPRQFREKERHRQLAPQL